MGEIFTTDDLLAESGETALLPPDQNERNAPVESESPTEPRSSKIVSTAELLGAESTRTPSTSAVSSGAGPSPFTSPGLPRPKAITPTPGAELVTSENLGIPKDSELGGARAELSQIQSLKGRSPDERDREQELLAIVEQDPGLTQQERFALSKRDLDITSEKIAQIYNDALPQQRAFSGVMRRYVPGTTLPEALGDAMDSGKDLPPWAAFLVGGPYIGAAGAMEAFKPIMSAAKDAFSLFQIAESAAGTKSADGRITPDKLQDYADYFFTGEPNKEIATYEANLAFNPNKAAGSVAANIFMVAKEMFANDPVNTALIFEGLRHGLFKGEAARAGAKRTSASPFADAGSRDLQQPKDLLSANVERGTLPKRAPEPTEVPETGTIEAPTARPEALKPVEIPDAETFSEPKATVSTEELTARPEPEGAGPNRATVRSGIRADFTAAGVPAVQVEAAMSLMDMRAQKWSQETGGRPVEDWWKVRRATGKEPVIPELEEPAAVRAAEAPETQAEVQQAGAKEPVSSAPARGGEVLYPSESLSFRGGQPVDPKSITKITKGTNAEGKTVYNIYYEKDGEPFVGYTDNPAWEFHEKFAKSPETLPEPAKGGAPAPSAGIPEDFLAAHGTWVAKMEETKNLKPKLRDAAQRKLIAEAGRNFRGTSTDPQVAWKQGQKYGKKWSQNDGRFVGKSPTGASQESNPILSWIMEHGGIGPYKFTSAELAEHRDNAALAKIRGEKFKKPKPYLWEEYLEYPLRVRRTDGPTPDLVIKGLIENELVGPEFSDADLLAITRGSRPKISEVEHLKRQDEKAELTQKRDKEWTEKASELVTHDQLQVGDTFTIKGEQFKVLEETDTAIHIKDGKDYWLSYEGEDQIRIDKGSMVKTVPVEKSPDTTAIPPDRIMFQTMTQAELREHLKLVNQRAEGRPLTPVQEQKLLEGEQQLGQKMAVDMESVKGGPAPSVKPKAPPPKIAGQKIVADTEMPLPGGEEKGGQRTLFQETPQTEMPAFRKWFEGSKVLDESGAPKVVYHGAKRADRIGTRFRKKRATSGPMAFFTDDPEIGSSYATGKADTSLEAPSNYAGWYKFKPKGSRAEVEIDRAWHFLSPEERATIAEKAPHIWEGDAGDKLQLDPNTNRGLGGYDQHIKEAKGNHLKALVEEWLSSGHLFNREEDFMKVLDMAGMKGVRYDDPWAERSGVFPVFLSIKNPLVTSDIPASVISALEQAAKGRRRPRVGIGADAWDKNTRDSREWVTALKEDLQKGTRHVWTSIPDFVTDTLKGLGYDGIHDVGGKHGGKEHTVWIPFEENQVKSAIGNRGTFDPNSTNILWQTGGPNIRRASITFSDTPEGRKSIIRAGKAPDIGSFLHELGHDFVEDLRRTAVETGDIHLNADVQTLEKWAGVKEGKWDKRAEEKTAEAFVEWVKTSKAPNSGVERIFQALRNWLLDIRTRLTSYGMELTPEVKAVFERMLDVSPEKELADALGIEQTPPAPLAGEVGKFILKARETGSKVAEQAPREARKGVVGLVDVAKGFIREMGSIKAFTPARRLVNKWKADVQFSVHDTDAMEAQLVRLAPDPIKRAGISVYREAAGDQKTIWGWIDMLEKAKAPKKIMESFEAATQLNAQERKVAMALDQFYRRKLEEGQKINLINQGKLNYATHIWETRGEKVAGILGGGLKKRFAFAERATYKTFFDGLIMGDRPKTMDAAELAGIYANEFNKVKLTRDFVRQAAATRMPDGRPAIGPRGFSSKISIGEKGAENTIELKPGQDTHDYVPQTHPAFLGWNVKMTSADGQLVEVRGDLAVHPDMKRFVNAMVGENKSRNWYEEPSTAVMAVPKTAVKLLDKASNTVKSFIFSFSGFHFTSTGFHMVSLKLNPFRLPKLNPSDPLQRFMIEHSLNVYPTARDIGRYAEGVGGGASVEALPVVGKLQKVITHALFHDFIPRMKMKTAVELFRRNMRTYAADIKSGKTTIDDVAYLSTRTANYAYGELNYTDMARDPTTQHRLRRVLIAPDYTEAKWGFVGLATRAGGHEIRLALARMVVYQWVISRIMNKLLDDDYHFDQPFMVVYKNRKYGIRSDVGDILHFFQDPNRFAAGRLSPIYGELARWAVTKRDWRGQRVEFTEEMKHIMGSVIPISFRNDQDLKWWEQFMNSMGVHPSRYSPSITVKKMALEWMSQNGHEPSTGTYPISKYARLRGALEDGDMERAQKELDALVKKEGGKVFKGFRQSTFKPFTDSNAMDGEFYRSLEPADKKMYDLAVKRRREIWERFSKLRHSSK